MSTSPDPFEQIATELRRAVDTEAHATNESAPVTPRHRRTRSAKLWGVAAIIGLTVASTATAAVLVSSRSSAPPSGGADRNAPQARHYTVTLTPFIDKAGATGWCGAAQLTTSANAIGAAACGDAPAGANPVVISGGSMPRTASGVSSILYAVVDGRVAAMKLGTGARITPTRDPSLPDGLFAIIAPPRVGGDDFATSAFEDRAGVEIPPATLGSLVPRQQSRSVSARAARSAPCSIAGGRGVAVGRQDVLAGAPRPSPRSPGRPFLTCASTIVREQGRPYVVAILLDAKDPGATPANLQHAQNGAKSKQELRGGLAARRTTGAWIVVRGTDKNARRRIVRSVRAKVRIP